MEISSGNPALEKASRIVLQARKPIIVIDWHNTLEKNNVVTAAALTGLEQLLDHCTVHILSFVQTWSSIGTPSKCCHPKPPGGWQAATPAGTGLRDH